MSFEQCLQQDWTPEVKQAWGNAYRAITSLMLTGPHQASLPTVVRDEKEATVNKPSESNVERLKKSKPFQPQLSVRRWYEILKQTPNKLIDAFWTQPVWVVATVSAVLMAVVFVLTDENSLLAKVLSGADTISLVLALVLFIKESPAWTT